MDPTTKFDPRPPLDIGLRVTVQSEIDGTTTDLLFDQPPVRIGRNKLNDLVLDHRYVSQWHALLGFVRGQPTIVQVSSSNPVVVGQRRLGPNEDAPLGQEPVRIVPYTLWVQPVELPRSPHAEQTYMPESLAAAATAAGTDQSSLEMVALKVLDRLTDRFLGTTLDDPEELASFGARMELVLDVFLRCFVALQKGQQQFRRAMDIKVLGGGRNPVEQIASPTQLGGLVFSGHAAIEALEDAFKNIMIHQVALLNGLMAGVRTLLAKLSPEEVTKEAGRERRSPNLRQLWQTYERIHRDLAEEDNETFETIFGPQFGKAYATLVGGERKPGRSR